MSQITDDGDWLTIFEGTSSRVQMRDLGDGRTAFRTQHFTSQQVIDANQRWQAELAGKRWGDGQVIGRMPDSLYFASGMAEARKNGDEAWIKRFWNDPDHAKLRVKGGQI